MQLGSCSASGSMSAQCQTRVVAETCPCCGMLCACYVQNMYQEHYVAKKLRVHYE